MSNAAHVSAPLEAGIQHVTMRTGAHYSREKSAAALDWANLSRKPSAFMAGVVWSEAIATDAFFVTLRKTESDYSPDDDVPRLRDLPRAVHWESQNATAVASPTGQRLPEPR